MVQSKTHQIVYSLCKHPYMGFVIEPHVVELSPTGSYSMTSQHVFSNTLRSFGASFDEVDLDMVKTLDEVDQTSVIKRQYKKQIRPLEFFAKHYDEKMHELLRPQIDRRLIKVLQQIKEHNKPLFLMSKDGIPTAKRLHIADEGASILFHFRRNETETRYFPTIKYKGERLDFMHQQPEMICLQEAWMLVGDKVYYFDQEVEGKKLLPFMTKRFIAIPRASEEKYFQRFVSPLIEKYHVYAEGFDIITEEFKAMPVLKITYLNQTVSDLQLYFKYDDYAFSADGTGRVSVRMSKEGDNYIFKRIKRSRKWEQSRFEELEKMGIKKATGLFSSLLPDWERYPELKNDPYAIVSLINQEYDQLIEKGFTFESVGDKRIALCSATVSFEVQEHNDWFDINAKVRFGEFEIPFVQLRDYINRGQREFTLPNGEIALIPEAWFARYKSLMQLSVDKEQVRLRKHHIGLVHDLMGGDLAGVMMDRKLQRLADFEQIEEAELPEKFNATLRPYQRAGYNWLWFLRSFNFGACLADDMGLGKTVQTLALLQKNKEEQARENKHLPSLLVVPTSLIYNWINELIKFAPDLRAMVYSGNQRKQYSKSFLSYDLIITTYGIARMDSDLFEEYLFSYIILDESHHIKNSSSKAFKALREFKSQHRLVLSGTPVENSVADLWTQMSFINPGLLGSENSFQQNYVLPIEKLKDESIAKRLQALIKPFVMRRTKEQVASELPPKTEQIVYCEMSEEQAELYERVKSSYRNEILENLENGLTGGINAMSVLEGLTKLRQLANHPSMIDAEYEGSSGKFEAVLETLEAVLAEKHKVLVFSQYVKHLAVFRKHLDAQKIPYQYLDGSVKNRGAVVEQFKKEDVQVFLISIKTGGEGLNLTEADYVFILDPWWNPAVEKQAVDRSHRIGQTKNVFVYKFISKDTVEEKILALQQRKTQVANELITTEENFFKSLDKSDIAELLG